jgi:phosphohistidine phosphatase
LARLILIRHAVAEDRGVGARAHRDDALRPLTKDGRAKMERAAQGLRCLEPSIDILASSPLLRATQTAAIVSAAYDDLPVTTAAGFTPEAPLEAGLDWLAQQPTGATIAVVGHEPHLGTFATWLLTGVDESRMPLRKGGGCLIEFASRPQKGEGQLIWFLPPAALRTIARAK